MNNIASTKQLRYINGLLHTRELGDCRDYYLVQKYLDINKRAISELTKDEAAKLISVLIALPKKKIVKTSYLW
jgi:hypothetical protein